MSVIAIGIDLVDISRVEEVLARRGERVLSRLLTEQEREFVGEQHFPARHLAARIGAKEATYKAMQVLAGGRAIAWREMEVVRGPAGRPEIVLHGLAARLAQEQGPLSIHLSLTHSNLSAAAMVLIERR